MGRTKKGREVEGEEVGSETGEAEGRGKYNGELMRYGYIQIK